MNCRRNRSNQRVLEDHVRNAYVAICEANMRLGSPAGHAYKHAVNAVQLFYAEQDRKQD